MLMDQLLKCFYYLELFLQSNQLTKIDEFTFKELSSLRYLYLSNNHLTTLDQSTFNGLTSLIDLELNSNKINCK